MDLLIASPVDKLGMVALKPVLDDSIHRPHETSSRRVTSVDNLGVFHLPKIASQRYLLLYKFINKGGRITWRTAKTSFIFT